MRITSLVENTSAPGLPTEHGLSLFVEAGERRFLFDMGHTDLFARNARALGVDLNDAEFAVLSHGHYDHGGGMETFFALNDHAPVYVSPHAFEPHYDGTEKDIGLDARMADSPRIVPVNEVTGIAPGMTLYPADRNAVIAFDASGLTVLRDGRIITHFTKENYDDDAIKTSMIGREMQGDYYRADNEPSWQDQVLLKADHLTGSGLQDISLPVRAGEILGIGGLSECGMHTLGKALFGSAMLTDGTVETEGKAYRNPRRATKLGVGYVSKERDTESLCQQASIRDNIAIGGLRHIQKLQLILRWRETAYVQKQVDALSIKCRHMEQPVSAMSGGNKQKVVFGKWLGAGSRVLILDCPTRGVDIGVKQSMYQLITRMKQEGKAILIISEEMAELIGMCDRLLVMKDGAVQKEFLRGQMNEADIIRWMI